MSGPVVAGQGSNLFVSKVSSKAVHDRVLTLAAPIGNELLAEVALPLLIQIRVEGCYRHALNAVAGHTALLFNKGCAVERSLATAHESGCEEEDTG